MCFAGIGATILGVSLYSSHAFGRMGQSADLSTQLTVAKCQALQRTLRVEQFLRGAATRETLEQAFSKIDRDSQAVLNDLEGELLQETARLSDSVATAYDACNASLARARTSALAWVPLISDLESAIDDSDSDTDYDAIDIVESLRHHQRTYRNALGTLVNSPPGETRAQTELALSVDTESIREEVRACVEGSDELEIEPLEDESAAALAIELRDAVLATLETSDTMIQRLRELTQLELDYQGASAELIHAFDDHIVLVRGDAAAAMNNASSMQIMSTAVAIAMLCAMFVWIVRQLIFPLKRTTGLLDRIATVDGDLTQRLDESRHDEFGDLARAFNTFVTKLGSGIGQAARRSNDLDSFANSLDESASTLTRHTEQAGSSTDSAVELAHRVVSHMGDVSSECTNMQESVSTVTELVHDTLDGVRSVSNLAETQRAVVLDAVAKTEEGGTAVDEMGQASEQVRGILEFISDIAEQTNLLALNATIEAARAGEAGRGFAVVANEVKNLATQTTEATGEVHERIQRMMEARDHAVSVLKSIASATGEVVEHTDTIGSRLLEHAEKSRAVEGHLQQTESRIANVTEHVGTALEEIQTLVAGLDHVNDLTASSNDVATQTKSASDELRETMRALTELLGEFRVEREALELTGV